MIGIMTLLFLVSFLFPHTTSALSTLHSCLHSRDTHFTTLRKDANQDLLLLRCHTTTTLYWHTITHHHPQAVPTPHRHSIDAAPDATGARVAAGPPSTLASMLTRRVYVRTPLRHRLDTVTPLAVPVCRTRLLAGILRTGGMSQSHAQAQAICHTLRTAHRIPRRPTGPTLVGPGL